MQVGILQVSQVIAGMSDRTLEYVITTESEGIKISEFLTGKGYSTSLKTRLKKDEDCVILNGEPGFINRRLTAGDRLIIHIKEETSSEKIPPIDIPIEVVYEDEDILVVNKPARMPIHPSMKNYENTLGNAIAYRYRSQGDQFVYRCINRLDRDTTGLTIIARNMLAACVLYDEMVARDIKRTYYAIVEGVFDKEKGTVDLPLGRKEDSAIERMVDYENGDRAVTHYEVLDSGNNMSLLKLHLETGRTHQIRVHMKAIGHPLIGDFLYNPDNRDMDRQALHAGGLAFRHPVSGEELSFEVPFYKDMQDIINAWHR